MSQDLPKIFPLVRLALAARPYLHVIDTSPAKVHEAAWLLNKQGFVARVLRGQQMQTVEGLFNEAAAALQFPDYFGHNWAAFEECLEDLEWLPGSGYVFLITDASFLLSQEPESELRTLVSVITRIGDGYRLPIAMGESWDRPARPFHPVLQEGPVNGHSLEGRLTTAGATYMK